MKIKLIGSAVLALSLLALSGCYDVGPYPGGGGYGYGGPAAYSEPAFAPGYAGGYYPGYSGFYPGGYYGGHYWGHDGWDRNHWAVPEHSGFIGHDYASRGFGRGVAVAHNEAFRGGAGFHGGESHGRAAAFHGGGGGFHGGGAHAGGAAHGSTGHDNGHR